ncbi:MAG: hypothetical protein JRJ20_13130, partial [Deltaproteobacteria bacterium]|nr:hypothetical protein [Deltaproteobacteria bacterium]
MRIILMLIASLALSGCWVYLSPTTYRCFDDLDALYEYREKSPGGTPGATKEQVRQEYLKSGSPLIMKDDNTETIYFLYDQCPIWRYRFKNDHLIAKGYLVQEMGTWSYVEKEFEKTRRGFIVIYDNNGKTIGIRPTRREPVYDKDGNLIGVKTTELPNEDRYFETDSG